MSTLTPKDCLYIEDLVNSSYLLCKEIEFSKQEVEDDKVMDVLTNVYDQIKQIAVDTCNILGGN